ncbi:MAG: hypothetical protein Q9168_005951 [Polycauliona sp. 1 TL-2023]
MADPLSFASGIGGLITLADVVFGRIFKYVQSVKGASEEISDLSSEVGTLYGILSSLLLVSRQLEDEMLVPTNIRTHHINSCTQTLEKMRNILDRDGTSSLQTQTVQSIKRKLRWPFSSSEVKFLLAECERHKATLGLALKADSMSALVQLLSDQADIRNTVDEIKKDLQLRHAADTRVAINATRQKILHTFGATDPTRNQKIGLKLRQPGTGLWLIEGQEYVHWAQIESSKLWLQGIPGAGKTVLAAAIIEDTLRTSSKNHAVAFYYCDYKDSATQNPRMILGSLIQQIAKQDEESFEKVEAFCDLNNPDYRTDVDYDPQKLRDLVSDIASSFGSASIVVDGLDECGVNAAEVTELLASLNSKDTNSNIRTLFLSRNEVEIRDHLEDYTEIAIAARSSDLRLYVGAELEARTRNRKLRIKDQSLKEYIMERLVDGAEGMHARGHFADNQLLLMAEQFFNPSKTKAFLLWLRDMIEFWIQCIQFNLTYSERIDGAMAEASVLHYASMLGLPELCTALLARGCDVNRNSAVGTPLHCALLSWNAFCQPLGLDPMAHEYNSYQDLDYFDPEPVVKILLSAGANPRCYQRGGNNTVSPLYISLYSQDLCTIRQLLHEGARFDEHCLKLLEDSVGCDEAGRYEVIIREEKDLKDVLNLMQQDNVEPEMYSRFLTLALKSGGSMTAKLIPNPSSIDKSNQITKLHYESALRIAAKFGQVELVTQILKEQIIDLQATEGTTGLTALHYAAMNDQHTVLKLLIESGADADKVDSSGRVALHYATSSSGVHFKAVRFLLKIGCEVNTTNKYGSTVLHSAVLDLNEGMDVVLDALFEHKIDAFHTREDGTMAIDILLAHCTSFSRTYDRKKLKRESVWLQDAFHAFLAGITDTAMETKPGATLLQQLADSWQLLVDDRHKSRLEFDLALYTATQMMLIALGRVQLLEIAQHPFTNPCLMMSAILIRQKELIYKLLEYSPDVDVFVGDMSILKAACLVGCGQTLLRDLLAHSMIQREDNQDPGLVRAACSHRDGNISLDMVKVLVQAGLDLNDKCPSSGMTPLTVAAENGNVALMTHLIASGADVHATGKDGDTNFTTSASSSLDQSSSENVIESRVAASPSDVDSFLGSSTLGTATPLQIAAYRGHLHIALLLLEHGASPHTTDEGYRTAISFAAEGNETAIIKHLLDYGANIHARDKYLMTPSMTAASHGSWASLQMLKRRGANFQMRAITGGTVLHYAAGHPEHNSIIPLLAAAGDENLGIEDNHGVTPLSHILRKQNWHSILSIINFAPGVGNYISQKDNVLSGGITNPELSTSLLKKLLRRLSLPIVNRLLKHQVSPLGTPLYAASTRAPPSLQADRIQLLLKAGAELEHIGGEHGTPLMGACAAGRHTAVKILVSEGARLCYEGDNETVSALYAARHFPDIVRWILVERFTHGPRRILDIARAA